MPFTKSKHSWRSSIASSLIYCLFFQADKATDAGPSSVSSHTCHRCPGQWCPVPIDDLMQLLANAWMNHFKTLFLAHIVVPPWTSSLSPTPQYNTQKCIRAGSKHNDLDAMGNNTPWWELDLQVWLELRRGSERIFMGAPRQSMILRFIRLLDHLPFSLPKKWVYV